MEPGNESRNSNWSQWWANVLARIRRSGDATDGEPRDLDVASVWRRTWYALNELAGHSLLVAAIMVVMVGLETANHHFGAAGLMVVDVPPIKLPLDWFFSLVDAGALSRLAWAGFRIFRNL